MDKQIEELMKDMCTDYPCNRICDQYCGMYDYAERAINAGYRKIPEGAVVLTGTETEERLEDLLIEFDEMSFYPATLMPNAEECAREWKRKLIYAIGQLRKETAETFAEKVKSEMQERDYMGVKYKQGVFTDSDIDEICKEITESK